MFPLLRGDRTETHFYLFLTYHPISLALIAPLRAILAWGFLLHRLRAFHGEVGDIFRVVIESFEVLKLLHRFHIGALLVAMSCCTTELLDSAHVSLTSFLNDWLRLLSVGLSYLLGCRRYKYAPGALGLSLTERHTLDIVEARAERLGLVLVQHRR